MNQSLYAHMNNKRKMKKKIKIKIKKKKKKKNYGFFKRLQIHYVKHNSIIEHIFHDS
jgi:hypothetical protein